ncbi:MAG: hypothetical protein HYV18_00675 [Gammaproteobacteria bacterium]|nr:hypothetical protein [Gammaproteobacteria bacterium]
MKKWMLGLATAMLAAPAWSQDSVGEAAGGEGAPPVPRPAVMAPLAVRSTLLDVARAGDRLVAVGTRGHILLSADGRDWQQVASPVGRMLTRVRFTGAQRGWAVGHDAAILRTQDGGATWTLQHFDGRRGKPLYDINFTDERNGFAVGSYGQYYVTTDGGDTWNAAAFPFTELGMHLNAIVRLNDGSLLIAGERGVAAHSTDGGRSWRQLQTPYSGSFFGALPLGERGAVIYGMRGNIYRVADLAACPAVNPAELEEWDLRETVPDPAKVAAMGWRHLDNPVKESLFGGAWLSDREAVLVGVNGVIRRVDAASGQVAAVPSPADEILSTAMIFRGRLLGVGRRGVQDLGEIR